MTTPTKYFFGNTLAAFDRNDIGIVEGTTGGGTRYDSTYVPNYIQIAGNVATIYMTPPTFSSATQNNWFHFDFAASTAACVNNSPWFTFYNGATGVFRIVCTSSTNPGTLQAQYWNGSAWTNTGSTFTFGSALATYDCNIDLTTGAFNFYKAGVSVASGGSWSGYGTTITTAQLGSPVTTSTQNGWWSQILFQNGDTRDGKMLFAALNGNSATNTGGTGAYTDINENPLDDSTAETVSVSGNKMGQTHAAVTVPSGYIIESMLIAARGRVSGTITDGKLGIRSGGTNYSSSGRSYGSSYSARNYYQDSDPATSTSFTQSGFNSAETYLEAA